MKTFKSIRLDENAVSTAFKVGRIHGKLGLPEIDEDKLQKDLDNIFAGDAYKHGYDHGTMEQIGRAHV